MVVDRSAGGALPPLNLILAVLVSVGGTLLTNGWLVAPAKSVDLDSLSQRVAAIERQASQIEINTNRLTRLETQYETIMRSLDRVEGTLSKHTLREIAP